MRELFKRHRATSAILVYLVFLYILFTIVMNPDPIALDRYDLSAAGYRLVIASIVLPVIAIWVVAFYGFMKFREYTGLISMTKDGKGFALIARGITILAIGLPVNAVFDAGLTQLTQSNPAIRDESELFANYINILFALVAFRYIARGAERLTATTRSIKLMSDGPLVGLLILAAVYCYLLFAPPSMLGGADTANAYVSSMPPWVIILTIIVPNLYIWFRGVSSAFYINMYRQNASGILYKKALHILAIGLALVIVSSVLLQYLHAIMSQVHNLSLIPVLLMVYVLLGIIAGGYVCIALGAKRLKRIEEV